MEENVISMFMDVKLDIRERKLEFSHLKSWTRYFVRVEAVKCFPCYIKISFFKSHTDDSTDLIVRINIPGLTVQMATSRTRAHSYGLFWKNNRKRCCAYFALPSQLLCERHLRWVKKSIRNLELYRQEILQLRRASRTPIHEIRNEMQPSPSNNDMGLYQNLDFTQNMADVYDILGPLPNVPNQPEVSMVQRKSEVSDIYEEIFDPNIPTAAFENGSRMSRASIASGIYEEMKLADIKEQAERNFEKVAEADHIAPPPLPPRPRSHTNEFELQRSYTTPESDYFKKKKHWLLFESMFGRRRTNSGSASSGGGDHKLPKADNHSTKKIVTSEPSQKVVYRDKVAHLRFSENKRNSFSSPDLSALKVDGSSANGSTDNISHGGSCSSEFYVQQEGDYIEEHCFASSESLSVSKCSSIGESLANFKITDEEREIQGMNVSENIVPNFNISSNTSTINLAGWNCMMSMRENPSPVILLHPEGYCEMGAPGTGFDRQKLQTVELRSRSTSETCNDESIYMNMDGRVIVQEEASRSSSTSSGVSSIYSNRSSVCSSNKHRNSIDDKIASYYPNEDFRTTRITESTPTPTASPKSREGSIKRANSKRLDSHYATSPKSTHRKASTQNISTIPRMSKSAQKPPCSKSRITTRSISSERDPSPYPVMIITDGSPTKNSENNPPETTVKLYKKYATVARGASTSSSKYQEKNSARKGGEPLPVGSSKRFGSLPRFAKIDLSPLRLKINSVLQRHNHDNL